MSKVPIQRIRNQTWANFPIEYASVTDVGRHRDQNEDSLLCLHRQGFFAIADGMGGHDDGEVASSVATHSLSASTRFLPQVRSMDTTTLLGPSRMEAFLADAIRDANDRVRAHANDERQSNMGTTLIACAFGHLPQHEVFVSVMSIGDSRAYLLDHKKEFEQVTKDQSLHGRLIGCLGPMQNKDLVFNPERRSFRPNTKLLLCSDGLSNMLEDEEIAEVMSKDWSPTKIAETLVNRANEAGGVDNITVILVQRGNK